MKYIYINGITFIWIITRDVTTIDCHIWPLTFKPIYNLWRSWLTVQRGQIHSPLGISGSGGLRQWMWYDEGQESQHSSSPPSLHTLQNSMWWSSSSASPPASVSSSPSDTSSRASHWMPIFSWKRKRWRWARWHIRDWHTALWTKLGPYEIHFIFPQTQFYLFSIQFFPVKIFLDPVFPF